MARKPSFKFSKTPSGWKVEIPERLSPTGERQRAFFSTRDEAKEYASELRTKYEDHGLNASVIKPSLAEEAAAAAELLKPFGISLLEAARMAVASKQSELQSSAIEDALSSFLKTKLNRSDCHTKAYRNMERILKESFPGRTLSSISGAELLETVDSHTGTPATFNYLSRLISAFWRWCARHPRDWCDAKRVEVLERRDTAKGEIVVLKAIECKRLMAAAEKHYPECVSCFAISLFTGMRAAELSRLQPNDITKEGIRVPPAESTKNKRRRFIQMPAPLKAWLKAYPIGDTVIPENWPKKVKAVRRLAGWGVWSDLVKLPAPPPDDFPKWPHNALRHTHATVWLAMGKPLDALIFEFGHSGGVQVLKSNYVGVMPKAEARKIMNIRPNSG